MSETTFRKENDRLAWLLGHEAQPNFESACLPPEVLAYYRANKNQHVAAIQRGYVLPSAIRLPAAPVEVAGYPIEETDCFAWIQHMETFASGHYGEKVSLRDHFMLPARLPWKHVLPVYIPSGMSFRAMVDKALKARKLSVYESLKVEKYSGSRGIDARRLLLIERSVKPTAATMGLPPKFAKNWFSGRQTVPLDLCGYGIATSLWQSVEKQYLDPETTLTWFPENQSSGGDVADGYGYHGLDRVGFYYGDAGNGDDDCGFREAIEVPLKQ